MFAAVILIDQCSNHAFLQAGFLCAVPHCLITEHPVYSNTTGSTISHISEFASGAKNLTKEIEKCILQFKETKPANPLACVIPAMPATNGDKLILSRSDDAIYINDIEMINKRTKIQFDILNLLTDSTLNDGIKKTVTYLNVLDIAHMLNKENRKKHIQKIVIHNAFSKIEQSLDQIISHDKIITHVHSFGYRLNTKNVAIKV
jgi:hypothetical protein